MSQHNGIKYMICRGWVTSCFNNKNVISYTLTSTVCHCVCGFICTCCQNVLRENILIIFIPKKKLSVSGFGWGCCLVYYWCHNQSFPNGRENAYPAAESRAVSLPREVIIYSCHQSSNTNVQWFPKDWEWCSSGVTNQKASMFAWLGY